MQCISILSACWLKVNVKYPVLVGTVHLLCPLVSLDMTKLASFQDMYVG